ncbi:MAG TPA: hypothetical protein PLW95_03870 [bacterium]|nr:hypothetical protein [bacterium]
MKIKKYKFLIFFSLIGLNIFSTCPPAYSSEIVFVWIDVTNSYIGYDNLGKLINYKEWAVKDLSSGIARIISGKNFRLYWKNYYFVIGKITGRQKGYDKLYEFPLKGNKWSEIMQILNNLENIPIEKYSENMTDIYGTYEYMARYLSKFKKPPSVRAIYYSDMIHELNRPKPNPESLNVLKGAKITAIFCQGEEYNEKLIAENFNRFQEQVNFLKDIGVDFFYYEPPGVSYQIYGETYLEKALKR